MHRGTKISHARARVSESVSTRACALESVAGPLPVVPARGAENVGPRSAAATESAAPRALTTYKRASALAWLGLRWPALAAKPLGAQLAAHATPAAYP
jgi:hypothetical protein